MLAALRPVAAPLASASRVAAVSRPAFARALPKAQIPRAFSSSPIRAQAATRFTAEHEWVAFDSESNVGTVGITDYAQKSLGDVVYVELPSEGSEVKQGEQIGAVESVKAASDIYCPVTGIITAVNDKLSDQPGLLNKSPEDKGWLCKIRLANPSEFESLLGDEAYRALCEN